MKKYFFIFSVVLAACLFWKAIALDDSAVQSPSNSVEKITSQAVKPKKNKSLPPATTEQASLEDRSPAQVKAANGNASDLQRLQKLTQCRLVEDCHYPQTDPKSYGLSLNKDVASLLKSLSSEVFAQNSEMLDLLRDWMKEGDGFTQEEALNIFAKLPPSQENLNAIISGVENNYADPLIFDQAMTEFSRYRNEQPQVAQFIAKTLIAGPQITAKTAANNLRKVLNKENLNYFKTTSDSVRSEVVKEAMKSALTDYQASLTGA